MGETTGISWADSTVNYWLGCAKVGPGCDNCYAEALMDKRFRRAKWGPKEERVKTAPANWQALAKYQRAAPKFRAEHGRNRIVFVNSLSDTFDNRAAEDWTFNVLWDVEHAPDVNVYLVTKRIGNVWDRIPDHLRDVPPKNLIILATIVNQEEWLRDRPKLYELTDMGFRVGLSVEPMLGPIDFDGAGIGWLSIVICGGESRQSGVAPRQMSPIWAAMLLGDCARSGVPFHMKQMSDGAPVPGGLMVRQYPGGWA